ncbi:hypothetical protein H4Q32_006672 [Labeo rohita]|uniref:Uncharacterized protein n=1 Tax=Labeo rohita TaxID=84645 RepID=A0ABQ8LTL9_LABRO|nr:hypothetical protein H4Q32_006672 [Labeo rohita]
MLKNMLFFLQLKAKLTLFKITNEKATRFSHRRARARAARGERSTSHRNTQHNTSAICGMKSHVRTRQTQTHRKLIQEGFPQLQLELFMVVIWIPVDLLAMPSGRDALSCCRRDFTNGSSSWELSEHPDPSCNAQWVADGVVVVDESGGVDESRVHHGGPQNILLKEKHTGVIFRMDCVQLEKSEELYCNGLCQSANDFSPTPEKPRNAANRSPSDGIFIFLSIIIIVIGFSVFCGDDFGFCIVEIKPGDEPQKHQRD